MKDEYVKVNKKVLDALIKGKIEFLELENIEYLESRKLRIKSIQEDPIQENTIYIKTFNVTFFKTLLTEKAKNIYHNRCSSIVYEYDSEKDFYYLYPNKFCSFFGILGKKGKGMRRSGLSYSLGKTISLDDGMLLIYIKRMAAIVNYLCEKNYALATLSPLMIMPYDSIEKENKGMIAIYIHLDIKENQEGDYLNKLFGNKISFLEGQRPDEDWTNIDDIKS